MEKINESNENWHPGKVEDRDRSLRTAKITESVDISAPFERLRGGVSQSWHVDDQLMRNRGEATVQPCADANQHLCPDNVEHTLKHVESDGQN